MTFPWRFHHVGDWFLGTVLLDLESRCGSAPRRKTVSRRKSYSCPRPSNGTERLRKPVADQMCVTPWVWGHHTLSPGHVQSRSPFRRPDRPVGCGGAWCRDSSERGMGWAAGASSRQLISARNAPCSGPLRRLWKLAGFRVSSPVCDFGSFCMAGRNASEDCHSALANEVTVLATQAALDGLAERIERAGVVGDGLCRGSRGE